MEYLSGRIFNSICFFAHFGSAVVMTLAASSADLFGVDGRVQLYIPLPTQMNEPIVFEPFWNPSVFGFLATFSFITALFHAFYFAMNGDQRYTMRFVEYSITASIMAIVLAILTGINCIFTLVGVGGLTMSTMLFGFIQEGLDVGSSKAPFLLGCVPYVFMWLIISWQFGRAMSSLAVPNFVVVILVLEIVLFSSFAVVQYYNKLKGSIYDKTADGLYNLLSLTSKMILVWVCFGGILGQQNN